jgi:hypothetical protein
VEYGGAVRASGPCGHLLGTNVFIYSKHFYLI